MKSQEQSSGLMQCSELPNNGTHHWRRRWHLKEGDRPVGVGEGHGEDCSRGRRLRHAKPTNRPGGAKARERAHDDDPFIGGPVTGLAWAMAGHLLRCVI